MDTLNKAIASIAKAQIAISKLRPSYCMEIISSFRKGRVADIEELHGLVDGMRAVIVDEYDGQRYELILKPMKESK